MTQQLALMPNSFQDLEDCAFFAGLDRDGLVDLFELVESETFPAGDVILEQGRTYQALWAIVRGRCEVVRRCETSRDQQLAVLEPGGIFGEMSFFQGVPHSATVRALTEVETVRLTPAQFEKLKLANVEAALTITSNLVRLLSDRLRRMDNWTCDLVDKSADGRYHREWKEFQSKLYTDWSF